MKHKNEFHMNIGGASIILLLIVFALTIFAALSVRASYHELKLAEETRRSVETYYEADAKALELKNAICIAFKNHVNDGGALETFSYKDIRCVDGVIRFKVEAGENNTLNVKLLLSRDGSVNVNEWRLGEYTHGTYEDSGINIEDDFGLIIIE